MLVKSPPPTPVTHLPFCFLTPGPVCYCVCRCVLEGVAFGTEVILDNMRQQGYHVDSLTLAGTAYASLA